MTDTLKQGDAPGRLARRRPPARVDLLDDEMRLAEQGWLPDLDFCRHALRLSGAGRVPNADHVAECAVCVRRWRVTEAVLQGWKPMGHLRAQSLLARMAHSFTARQRDQDYRPFYAHLAGCAKCEREVAEMTFDKLPESSAGSLGRRDGTV